MGHRKKMSESLLLQLLLLDMESESEDEELRRRCRRHFPASIFRPLDTTTSERIERSMDLRADGVERKPHDGQMDFSSGRLERTRIHRQ